MLQSKPSPVKYSQFDVTFMSKEDNVYIDDRESYADTPYEKLLADLKHPNVVFNKPLTKVSPEVKNLNFTRRQIRFIRLVEGVLITIGKHTLAPTETKSERPVKVIIEGELFDAKRLPKQNPKNKFKITKATLAHYLNNREVFIEFINAFFNRYK